LSVWKGIGSALAPDDVVYLNDFRLPWVDVQLRKDRPETLTESIKLLLRVPHLTDLEVPVLPEADLVIEPGCGKNAVLIQPTNSVVVLLGSQRRRRKRIGTLTASSSLG
jgi:hypothetical protein